MTIPEGLTVREIAVLLENMQIANKEKFLAAAADPNLLAGLGLQDKGLKATCFRAPIISFPRRRNGTSF